MCMLLYPIFLDRISVLLKGHTSPFIIFSVLMAVLVIVKHRENIGRLLKGTESKFSIKKSKSPESVQEQELASPTDGEQTAENAKKPNYKKKK